MATNLYIEVANRKGITSPSDHNPIVPPDLSPPGTYQFNAYYLDFGNPDTYHRYQNAAMELNIRQNGPPTDGSFTCTFLTSPAYTTAPLDISSTSADDLQAALEALPSIRAGNVKVTGNAVVGYAVELIGNRSGLAQPIITCNASGCSPASTATVKQISIGGINGSNSKQLIIISQARVATINAFTELTASSLWGWTTSSGLSTAGISQAFWQNPAYDVVLEVKLFIAGSRSGTDGVTSQLAASSGTDGVIGDDGRTRSGTDGIISSSPGRSGTGYTWTQQAKYFITWFKATASGDPSTYTYGTSFIEDDVGRSISGTYIAPGTVITGLIPTGPPLQVGANAYISPDLVDHTKGDFKQISWTTNAKILKTFQSSGANFAQVDVGLHITGPNFQPGTTIFSVQSATQCTLSLTPLSYGSGVSWTITGGVGTKYTSTGATFTSADVGRSFTGTNVQSGTVVATFIDSHNITLSKTPTATGTGLSWAMAAQMSAVYQSASASFTTADTGKILSGTNIPSNTTITYIDATHAALSQLPTAIGTGLSWQIIATGPGASGAPAVTDIVTGDSTHQAIQQIAFAELPDYGTFTLQDGAGGQPITSAIPVPLNAGQIQDALNTAYPAKQPFFVQAIAPTIFQVTFGVTGAQSHLIVDDTNIVYDNLVLQLILVPGVGVGGGPGGDGTAPPIIYDGNFASEKACGPVREESIPNSGGAKVYRQRFNCLATSRPSRSLNSAGPKGGYLIESNGCQDVGGGVVEYDYVWVTLPPNRTDPIFGPRTFQAVAKTFSGATLVDQQLWSISVTQRMTRYRIYSVGYPGWNSGGTPAGVIIHWINGTSTLLGYNGFQTNGNGTFFATWYWSINITRWMGDLWEIEYING